MWNPEQYLKYKDERTQPSYDLVARVALPAPASIIDIGCGPGNSTRVLRERWPDARILGLDNSPEMIRAAREAYPQESWLLADAAQWETQERFDLVFSNAVIQWIPDHASLISRLFGLVTSGGALAVQVPSISASPVHQALLKVSQKDEWSALMQGCADQLIFYPPDFYYDLLTAISSRFYIWQTIYYHVLADHQELVEWYAGTGMRPYLERLATDVQKADFRGQVLEECRPFYPVQADGKVLFPFNRLFLLAYKEPGQSQA